MSTITKNQFEQRYHVALRLHLGKGSRGKSSLRTAHALGTEAVSLKLGTLALARIHDRALTALDSPRLPASRGSVRISHGRAGLFFRAALAPVEASHPAARAAARRAQRLGAALRGSAFALEAARREARREIVRRQALEKRLIQGKQHYRQLLAQSHRMQRQSRHLAHRILSAQEEERKEISRELHDEVAQILAGINVQLATLKATAIINSQGLRKRIALTQRLVGKSVQIVHRYARELRPSMLDDLGLIPALRSYIKDILEHHGLHIRFTAFSGVEILNNARRTALYRVAQEALTNVVRHARAQHVRVSIRKIAHAIRLEVRDDGQSFQADCRLTAKATRRLGLIGMRERIEMVGGIFSIESKRGTGTTVRADVPFGGKRGRPKA